MEKQFYVYIVTNKTGTVFYTGLNSSFDQETPQPKETVIKSIAAGYNADRLVYFEIFKYAYAAISREKQMEDYTRSQKIQLINSVNPDWKDLRKNILQPESHQIQ